MSTKSKSLDSGPPPKMVTVLLISSYDEFFTRSKGGAIWGRIYFRIGDSEFFPEKGWTDLVVAFLRGWLGSLLKISEGTLKADAVNFYDGPLNVGIRVTGQGVAELAFTHREKVILYVGADLRALLENSLDVAQELLSQCQEKSWTNDDTAALTILALKAKRALKCG
jgi:hypothetical protein